jgi:hypothetical protein
MLSQHPVMISYSHATMTALSSVFALKAYRSLYGVTIEKTDTGVTQMRTEAARELRHAREFAGLTQEEAADRTGVSVRGVASAGDLALVARSNGN